SSIPRIANSCVVHSFTCCTCGNGQNSGGYGSQGGFGNGGSNPQAGGFAPKAPQQPASAPADLDDDLPF
ncbi:hypothetical protein ACFMKD_28380, partial [Acinetobacter baumannii]